MDKLKWFISLLKVLAVVLIIASVYFAYSSKTHFEIVISSFIFLIGVFVIEYFLPYIYDYRQMKKRYEISKKETQNLYAEKAEIEILKKDVEELKGLTSALVDTMQTLSNSLKEISENISEKKQDNNFNQILSLIKDPILKQAILNSAEDKKGMFLSSIRALNFFKERKEFKNISVEDLAKCVFLDKNCILAEALIFAKEYSIFPSEFVDTVKKFYLEKLQFRFKGETFKNAVIVYKDCVYVNFALLRYFYKNLLENDEKSKELEPYFAIIFKDYLCPSINWKNGFIKRMFAVKENNKTTKKPLIAFKKYYFEELKPSKNIEVIDG